MQGYKSRNSDVWHKDKDCQGGFSEAQRFTLELAKAHAEDDEKPDLRPCDVCCGGEWPDEEE